MSYANTLIRNGYIDLAIQCARELLDTNIVDSDNVRYITHITERLEQEEKVKKSRKLNSDYPEDLAATAIYLHDSGEDIEAAWRLIMEAKEKYRANKNWAGAGRCENNMGNFCLSEKNIRKLLIISKRHY